MEGEDGGGAEHSMGAPVLAEKPSGFQQQKRPRPEFEEVGHDTRWRDFIIRLGDVFPDPSKSIPVAEQLEACRVVTSNTVAVDADAVRDLLMQCALELPHKDPFYGVLVGLLNLEHPEFAGKVVHNTWEGLQIAMEQGKPDQLRILLRFLSCMMNCNVISPSTLVEVFTTLATAASASLENPAWQPRSDFFVFCVMAALPFCGEVLAERAPEDLAQVLAALEGYMNLRDRKWVPVHLVFQDDQADDALLDLWQRLHELAEKDAWKAGGVPRPHQLFEVELAMGEYHNLPQPLAVPPVPPLPPSAGPQQLGLQFVAATSSWALPPARLHIFPASKSDEAMSPIDRFLVEEYIKDVLHYLNGCRRECTAALAGLPVPFRYEYVLAETIFGQMLQLPRPPFKLIYYTIVIVDLCKALPGAFPPTVAAAVRTLFQRVSAMDVECRSRLAGWLAHHLSNFQFVWPWGEWSAVLTQKPWEAPRLFAADVLEKEVRLAYWDKIKESLSASPAMTELLPPRSTPSFAFQMPPAAEGAEAGAEVVAAGSPQALSAELVSQIRARKAVRELRAWVEESMLPVLGAEQSQAVVAHTLLQLGSKSFTHIVNMIERYGQLLQLLATTREAQAELIGHVDSFWQNSAQMRSIVIDRFMGYRIVSNLAIVDWVFSPGCKARLHTGDSIWEVLRNIINKTNGRTSDLRRDLAACQQVAQAAADKAERASASASALAAAVPPPPDPENAEAATAYKVAAARVERAQGLLSKLQQEAVAAADDADVKEVLLARALGEQEALYEVVVVKFAEALAESALETMDVDQPPESSKEGDEAEGAEGSATEGKAAWLSSVRQHFLWFSRSYAAELWPILDRFAAALSAKGLSSEALSLLQSGLAVPGLLPEAAV